MVGEVLSQFCALIDGLVEDPDDVLRAALFGDVSGRHESGVVVEDVDEPSCVNESEVPFSGPVTALLSSMGSFYPRCLDWSIQA